MGTCEDHGTEVGVWRVCEVVFPSIFKETDFPWTKNSRLKTWSFCRPKFGGSRAVIQPHRNLPPRLELEDDMRNACCIFVLVFTQAFLFELLQINSEHP